MKQIYTILLKKNFSNDVNLDAPIHVNNVVNHWIALGHYDDIYTYHLNVDHGNLPAVMNQDRHCMSQKNTQKENVYYYPLYLIPYSMNTAMISPLRFVAIIRLHLKESINVKSKCDSLEAYLKYHLDSTVLYQLYYATDFSDIVLELQCSRLDKLIHCSFGIRTLYTEFVGKMYTYFGILLDFLKKATENVKLEDKISLLSMRFSGYDTFIMQKQIQLIQQHIQKNASKSVMNCVNGIDDILLEYHDVLTSDIISLYREWLLQPSCRQIRKSISATKLGTALMKGDYLSDNEGEQYLVSPEITPPIFQSLLSAGENIMYNSVANLNAQGWFDALSEISYSLVRMSKTPVMDKAAYLIAPAFQTFMCHIQSCLFSKSPLNMDNMYEYTEDCSYLIEQFLRVEGQLSHNPEIRPIMYRTPIFMLEFTMAFLNEVSSLLQHDDNGDSKQIRIFLVPCPCKRTNALEVFPPNGTLPGLVHIRIPEYILDTPEDAFRTLCHETSHYIGETYRCRMARITAYSCAAASLLSDRVFKIQDTCFIEFWSKAFLKELNNHHVINMVDMHNTVISIMEKKLYNEENFIDTIIRQYFDQCRQNDCLPQKIPDLNPQQIQLLYEKEFKSYLGDIDILFREVFADICMIHLLNVDIDTYVESLLCELSKEKKSNDTNITFLQEVFATRIWSTLSGMNHPITYNGTIYRELWSKVWKAIKIIEESQENEDLLYEMKLNPTCYLNLSDYAQTCYKKISTSIQEQDLVNIRKMYSIFSISGVQYEEVLTRIESYRRSFIDTNKETCEHSC